MQLFGGSSRLLMLQPLILRSANGFQIYPCHHCVRWSPGGSRQRVPFPVKNKLPAFLRLYSSSTTEEEATVSEESPTKQKIQKIVPPLLGGDFCGLSATFDLDGKHIPIPEHLIPKSLLEWGQAPSSLEVIVSEDINDVTDTKTNAGSSVTRSTLTIFPETGCGIDSLEVTKSQQEAQVILPEDEDDPVCSLSVPVVTITKNDKKSIQVESIFGWGTDAKVSDKVEEKNLRVRLSVSAELDDDNVICLVPPVQVVLEHRFNETSTGGSLAGGGGLDGQRVSRWMGPTLRKMQDFAVKDEAQHDADNVVVLPANLTLSFRHDDGLTAIEMGRVYEDRVHSAAAIGLRGETADEEWELSTATVEITEREL